MWRIVLVFGFALLLVTWRTPAAEALPQKPAKYFNDYAGVVSADAVARLDEELRRFERDTSNQIVVAVFSKLETASSIQDYTFRIAESWKVGQKGRDNGAVLFVFIEARQMFIQVGYGLEGALPDITCKQIIENEIIPHFRGGNYDAGLIAGVRAMMAATKGEYKGTGRVAAQSKPIAFSTTLFLIFGVFFAISMLNYWSRRRGTAFTSRGRRTHRSFWFPISGGGWSGGSGGGGGFSGGGFSGGGGSFGGGGAGGSW